MPVKLCVFEEQMATIPSFSTQNTFPNLRNLLHDECKEMPWRASPDLLERGIKAQLNNDKLKYTKVLIRPTDPEYKQIEHAFFFNPPTKYTIKRAYYIHNAGVTQDFETRLIHLEDNGKNSAFNPDWDTPTDPDNLQRKTVNKRFEYISRQYFPISLKHRQQGKFDKTFVIPIWHGFKDPSICPSICQTGFFSRGQGGGGTDPGWYGNGIYGATDVKYAVDGYSKDSGFVFYGWFSTRAPYPVVPSDFTPIQKLLGKANRAMYSAHFIPVHGTTPCPPGKVPSGDEIVVFQQSQALPRFLIELQPNFPVATAPKTTGELLSLILIIRPLLKDEPEIQEALEKWVELLFAYHPQDLPLSIEEEGFIDKLIALSPFHPHDKIDKAAKIALLSTPPPQPRERKPDIGKILELIGSGETKEAWQSLNVLAPRLLNKEASLPDLFQLLHQLIPTLLTENKDKLFKKFIEPLRRQTDYPEKKLQLELDIARWLLKNNQPSLGLSTWIDNFAIPALECYGKALALAEANNHHAELCSEASKVLLKPLLAKLPSLDQEIEAALMKSEQTTVEEIVKKLTFVKTTFSLEKSESDLLADRFKKMLEFFANLEPPSEIGLLAFDGLKPNQNMAQTFNIESYRQAFKDPKGIIKFSKSEPLKKIKASFASFGLAEFLEKALQLVLPTTLKFTHDTLSEELTESLAEAIAQTHVTELHLAQKGVSEKGKAALHNVKNKEGKEVILHIHPPSDTIDFSPQAPIWQRLQPGLNLQGVCENKECDLLDKLQWFPASSEEKLNMHVEAAICYCSKCKSSLTKVDEKLIGFYQCTYSYKGTHKTDDKFEQVDEPLAQIQPEKTFVLLEDELKKKWTSLVFTVKKL